MVVHNILENNLQEYIEVSKPDFLWLHQQNISSHATEAAASISHSLRTVWTRLVGLSK